MRLFKYFFDLAGIKWTMAATVVLVYGLPACGKSTLLRAISSAAGGEDRNRLAAALGSDFELHWLSYDEAARRIEARGTGVAATASTAAAAAAATTPSPLPGLASWHEARERAIEYTRLVCAAAKPGNSTDDAWMRVQEAGAELGVVCTAGSLSTMGAGGGKAEGEEAGSAPKLAESSLSNEGAGEAKHVVLALDDNFYYRSMRFPLYRVAAQQNAAFAQLLLTVAVDEAVRRDAAREGSACVGEATIRRMDLRFEPAAQGKGKGKQHRWEVNSGCAAVCTGLDVGARSLAGEEPLETPTTALLNLIASAKIAAPLRRPEDELSAEERADRERERRRCLKSRVHAIDLGMRKAVGMLMRRLRQERGKGRGEEAAEQEAQAGAAKAAAAKSAERNGNAAALWKALCACLRRQGLDPRTASAREVSVVLAGARKRGLQAAKESPADELELLLELAKEEEESVETLLAGRIGDVHASALLLAALCSRADEAESTAG